MCGDSILTGFVTIEPQINNGEYYFSDWSFGAIEACATRDYDNIEHTLTFTDYCQGLYFTDVRESFWFDWSFSSEIVGDEWRIEWSNDIGESGKSILYYPNGEHWPISITTN